MPHNILQIYHLTIPIEHLPFCTQITQQLLQQLNGLSRIRNPGRRTRFPLQLAPSHHERYRFEIISAQGHELIPNMECISSPNLCFGSRLMKIPLKNRHTK